MQSTTEVDHKQSRASGGLSTMDNLQGLCHSCHSRKTATEDGRWLARNPALRQFATATPATFATDEGDRAGSVARVANVAGVAPLGGGVWVS